MTLEDKRKSCDLTQLYLKILMLFSSLVHFDFDLRAILTSVIYRYMSKALPYLRQLVVSTIIRIEKFQRRHSITSF